MFHTKKTKNDAGLGRVTPIIALVVAVTVLVVGIAMIFYNEHSYRAQKTKELTVQAQILAATVSAALLFNDTDVAQEYVNALRVNPEIIGATIFDHAGSTFVTFQRETLASSEQIALTVPVGLNGSTVGSVRIFAVEEPLARRLVRYGAIGALVVMTSLVVAILGMAHRAAMRANRHLTATNEQLREQIEERERAEKTLRQVQKMETIGQLTGGVAHDFNNLLTIVLGNLERLRRRLDGDLAVMADQAIKGGRRAATLTKSLLAFSRQQALRPEPIDVNRLVTDMSDLLRRTLGPQITIETSLPDELWPINADFNQLENAILNLSINSRDAMPNGGHLYITTANVSLDAPYLTGHHDVKPGNFVVISISDTGTGMTEETRDRAFEPFFTTKDIGKGTGLGMSQVYGFVKQSGGHVTLYSRLGEGTTVRIYLPRLYGVMPVVEETQNIAPPTGNETILVVEDEYGVREHSVAVLNELGYSTYEAANGKEALAVLRVHPEIDLLFTDIGLPGGMTGRQLAQQAVIDYPNLAVLLTSGYAHNAMTPSRRDFSLVAKPFSLFDLAQAVRQTLDAKTKKTRPLRTVLVVEDELLIRMNLVETLERLGLRVLEAANGTEALEHVQAEPNIDLAIIDLGLPDMSGDVVAGKLKPQIEGLYITIASGFVDETVKNRFLSDRLVDYLDKPYTDQQILATLRWAGLETPPDGD